MAILYKGKVIRKIEYKGIKIKKAYKDNVLIFSDSFFTKLLVRMSSTRIDGRKNILNLSWETWEEERVRLSNIVADKQRDYNKAVDDLKPYEDAYNKAVRDRDSWLSSHPKPPEERVTQAWKDWDDVRRYLLDVYRASVRSLERYKEKEPTKTIDNPDWNTWNTEKDRLYGVWQDAKSAYNTRVSEISQADEAYNIANASFNAAVRARDDWKAKEPSKTITVETQAWKDWESTRISYADDSQKADDEYRIYNRDVYGPALTREIELYDDHIKKEKTYNDAVASGAPESVTGPLKTQMDEAYAAWDDYFKNTYKPISDRDSELFEASEKADKAYDDWITANPEPARYETITNPEWTTWEEERKRLQQKVNTTYANKEAKKKTLDQKKEAWAIDEPTYSQNIKNAESAYNNHLANEPDKTITNPAWTTWNNGLPPYEEAVARDKKNYDDHLAKEPTKYEPNPDYDRWIRDKKTYDDAVSSAYYAKAPYESIKNSAKSALESAQRDYNNHLSKEPAKRIETSAAYYKYSFDISFKDLPTPEDISNDSLTIRVKINNTQSEADRQDAIFIGQDRGPNPAYLDGSLNLKNTSTTLSTTWASMDMIYSEANITISSSEGFTKTYVIDINKDFITDDFMFRYPD